MFNTCELANLSVHKNSGPFGCTITDCDYNYISQGHNMVTITNDPTAHAEIVAIRKACEIKNNFDYILHEIKLIIIQTKQIKIFLITI